MLQNIIVLLQKYGLCAQLEGTTIYINRDEKTQSVLMFKFLIIPKKLREVEKEIDSICIESQYQSIITECKNDEYQTIYLIKNNNEEIGKIVCNTKEHPVSENNKIL